MRKVTVPIKTTSCNTNTKIGTPKELKKLVQLVDHLLSTKEDHNGMLSLQVLLGGPVTWQRFFA